MNEQLKSPARVLVVDDDSRYGEWLRHHLDVLCPEASVSLLNRSEFEHWCNTFSGRDCDLVLLAATFGSSPEDPGSQGLDLLRRLRAQPAPPAVVAIAEDGNELTAVRALQLGALDYVPKRLLTPERLNTAVRLALRRIERRVTRRLASLTHLSRQHAHHARAAQIAAAGPDGDANAGPAGGAVGAATTAPAAGAAAAADTAPAAGAGAAPDTAPAAGAAAAPNTASVAGAGAAPFTASADGASPEGGEAEAGAPAAPAPMTSAVAAAAADGAAADSAAADSAAADGAAANSAAANGAAANGAAANGAAANGAAADGAAADGAAADVAAPIDSSGSGVLLGPAVAALLGGSNAEIIPGYTLRLKIGESEKAVVYLAASAQRGYNVALKVSKTLRDEAAGRQFLEREYTAIMAVRSPLVVEIYDYGVHGGFEYLAMEYLPRGDLKARIQRGVSERQAMHFVARIAAALQVVHAAGLVHRDLKPPNVMLRENDAVALIDFGLARSLEGTSINTSISTRTGVLHGSPYYMSPEQALGESLDARSDFYSLGVIGYEMLTGHKPYTGDSAMEVLQQHVSGPLPMLPPELARYQTLISRLLAKSRDERPGSAAEIIAAATALREGAAAEPQSTSVSAA